MKKQIIYEVEKFVPTHCPQPSCRNQFAKNGNGEDGFLLGTFWRHESTEVTGAIFKSISHAGIATDLIVCGKCNQVTLRVKIESRRCERREDAERFLAEGFVNLQELERVGGRPFRGVECCQFLLVREDARVQEAMLFNREGVHHFKK